jgi:hypothetical protein
MQIDITETHITLTIPRDELPPTYEDRDKGGFGEVRQTGLNVEPSARAAYRNIEARFPFPTTEGIWSDGFAVLTKSVVATHLAHTEAEDRKDTLLRNQLAAMIEEHSEGEVDPASVIAQRLMDAGVYILPPAPMF